MRLILRLFLLLLAWGALGRSDALAQACTTATTTFNFSTRPSGEDWTNRTAVGVPAAAGATTIRTNGSYSSTGTTVSTLQIPAANSPLTWTDNFTSVNGTSQVTFTFNRAVANFTVQVGDIDAMVSRNVFGQTTGAFTDQVVFAGANAGTAVTPTLSSTSGATLVTITGTTATGVDDNNTNTAAVVTATFPQAITTLTLTYKSGPIIVTDPDQQIILINQMTWCRLAPVANNVTNSVTLPTNAGQVNIDNLSSTVDGTVGSYTITAIPPAAQGVLYYNSTGSTYVAVANGQALTPAQAASLRFDPAAGATGTSTAFSYTVTDDANLVSNTATFTIPLSVQTACAATAALDYSNTTARPAGEDWKNHAAISVPAGSPLTTIGTNGYSVTGNPTANTLQTGVLNGTAQTLVWSNDYPASGAADKSTVTFNFSRAVSNFTIQVQDIDATTGFQDQVTFTGSNGGTTVTPVLSPVNPNAAYFTVNGNTATGVVATGGNSSTTDASVVAYFGAPITSLTITYNNVTNTTGDPGAQFIGIDLLNFCRLAPVANPVASSVSDAATKAPVGSLTSQVDGTVTSYSFTSVPTAAQGTLFIGNTAVTTGTVITPAQASQLTFTPAAGFSGTLNLAYTVKDDANQVSNPATYAITVNPSGAAGTPAACANPGKDGSPTGLTTNPNTYYPATQSAAAGATSITLGTATGATTPIAAGDLLLVIQMQGADINSTNTDAYGDGVANGGANGSLNTNFAAGTYEYVVATGPVAGGAVPLATALKNSYQNADATATAGQRRFQVIRVPQYSNLTLGGNITATPWNGTSGGIIVLDVAKQTNLAGFTINASGAGFRGGAGRRLQGGAAGVANTDYVTSANLAENGTKGEGIAGTPRYVNVNNNTLIDTRTTVTGYPAILPATFNDGYPGGDNARGAPGNAGGGGTDGKVDQNEWNSGGGGGANGGQGGRGGNSFSNNLAIGGEPGAAFAAASSSRLVLGGGGGSGTTNDGTGTPNNGLASSGAAGGGIVMLRTGTVSGTGTITANGANANNTVQQDGGGGGGAGGSILITAATTSGLSGLTLNALGGTGGNTNPNNANNAGPHGPGGGGGGGVILTNGNASSLTAAAGTNGLTTANGSTTGVAFGAAPGVTGDTNTQISNSVANSVSGASCPADVTTTITGPTTLSVNQPAGSYPSYRATFTNNGTGTAANVTQTVTLPAGATVTAANLPTGATTSTTGTGATAVTTINFGTIASLANGASNSYSFSFTAPATAGSYPLTSNVATDANEGANTAANAATLTIQVTNAPANCAPSYYDNTNAYSGLSADYYSGNYNNTLTYFNTNTPKLKRVESTINFVNNASFGDLTTSGVSTATNPVNQNFSARYRGSFTITTAGNYTFSSDIDDNLQIWVDGNAIPATGAPQTTTFTPTLGNAVINVPNYSNGQATSAAVPLSAGAHNILIFFGAGGGPNNITLKYSGPDTNNSTVIVPNSVLCAGPSNVPPTALAVTNPAIPGNSGPTTISALNGTDFETTGSVTNYAIATLPANGTLRLGGVAVTAGQVITAAQAATLTHQPNTNFVGTDTFTFSAIDNSGQYSNTTATFTIPVTAADVATTITGPATLTGNVATANNAFTATFSNNGPAAAANVTRIITLPPGATMTAAQVTASGGTYTAPTSNTTSGTLDFGYLATLASGSSSSFSFGLVPYNGGSSPVSTTSNVTTTTAEGGATANNTATRSSTVKFSPVPAYVTSTSISSTAAATPISALSATDQDGTVASFTITSIPSGADGVLYYNNNADGSSGTYQPVTVPLTLTPAQAGSLRFDPTGKTVGNVTFTYTATDNEGNVSTTANNGGTQVQGAAVYTIPVSNGGIAANNDSNTVPLNTPKSGNVLLNDYNPNNTGLAVALAGTATAGGTTTTFSGGMATTAHGTVTIAANGTYTYTPNTGYIGSDTFAYQVCSTSGTSMCATALVTLRVYDPGTACTSGTGPNLLANPDFNQGNTGFASDYTFVTKPNPLVMNMNGLYPEFTYAVDSNPQDYHLAFTGSGHTSGVANDKFMMLNGGVSIARIYSQTVTVQPNRYYTFSGYFNNLLAPGTNKGVPEVGFVINGESASSTRMVTESPDRWIEISDIWYSGSNTTATFEIRNVSTAASGNDFAIDDVYFGTCNLAPIANNDLRTTPRNTSTTFSATANDTDGDGAVVPSTFLFSNGTKSITVTGGTFTADNSGNVTFTPTSGFTGTAVTTYTVQDNNPSPAATSNPATISVTVGPPPLDLSTAIAASATTVNAGATETLTVTASNNGPTGTATNVTQTVQLPAGLTNVTFGTPTVGSGATLASGSASYNSTTGLVTFPAITSQANGTTGNVAYTVSFNAPANGPFTATANVASADNSDTNPANNAASTTIAVSPRFDLVTTLSGPTTAVQGGLVTYTVTSANNGPSIAPNAVQTVTGLPTGLTQVFVSNGGYYNATTGTQTLYYANGGFTTTNPGGGATAYTLAAGGVLFPPVASFANGQAASNTISFVAPASGTTITPVATLTPNTSGAGETNTANNTASLNGTTGGATTTTPATANQANLSVASLTTSASSVAAGTAVTVNVTYKNSGPSIATGVIYQLSLTPGTVITSTLPAGASYNSTTGIVSFNSAGTTLASAGTQSGTLTFTAPSTGPVLVAASVSGTTSDPVPADNYASTKVDILPSADVATTITGPASTLAGQSVTYAVTTTNNGAAAAQNVVQTVELPSGLPVATLQLNGSTGTLNAGVITFTGGATYNVSTGMLTLPTIASAAAGSTTTNEVTFVAPSGGASFSATAAVSSNTPDAVPTNNTATTTTTVTPSVDVRTLVSGPASVPVFSPMTLSVTTLNDGPSVAATVAPTLQLPTNLANVVLPAGASYNSTTGLVTFATISNLASGAAVTNSVSFTMPDVAQVTALGTSTVSGGAVDRNGDNNRVSFTTTSATPTDQVADLSATVTSSAGSVAAGSPVTFTLTIANGPASTSDAASNIRPVLALPAGLDVTTIKVGGQLGTFTSGTGIVTFPGGATYNVNTGQVIFPVVSTLVASDASGYAPLAYTVTVAAPGIDPLVATASVTSATSDPTPANNQQTLNVTVTQSADLVTSISGPASAPAPGGSVTYAITTTNQGATLATNATTTVVLPIASGASYSVNGGAAQTYNGTSVTLPVVSSQQPGTNGAVTNTISFTSPSGAPGSTFAVTATASTTTTESNTTNNGSNATTIRANQTPVAQNVVNKLQAPEGNTAGQLAISPLAATDADGTILTYQVVGSLPPTSQGVLYYNNNADGTSGTYVALPLGQALSQAQANNLRFDPAAGYTGNVSFSYTATDNLGGVSNTALYTIPVGTDNSSVYTATPAKGGATQYQNNDVLAYAIDPNGASYTAGGLVYNASGTTTTILATGAANGLGNSGSAVLAASGNGPAASGLYPANPTNVLPAGVSIDPNTGLIYVSDRTQLVNNTTQRYYQVNVITTDIYGGTNVTLAQFTIGANPLPVVLTAFTAQAVQNRDALLNWATASEQNSASFEIERSLDGNTFTKIGQVAAQGTSTSATAYAFTDAGIGARVRGSVYYRLRQLDLNGAEYYSPVRTVSFTKAATVALSVYPNPATASTVLDLSDLPASASYRVVVLDAVGRQVLITTQAGGLPQPLDLTSLASGTYNVLVTGKLADGSALRQTLRLIKE